jgi:rubrerythrin
MSMNSRYQAAHDKYFASNPSVLAEIESVNLKMLENLGMTMEEWRTNQRYLAFANAAEAHGMQDDEFVIRLVAESSQQAHAWRLERHREIAASLGIPWAEYKQLNGISE